MSPPSTPFAFHSPISDHGQERRLFLQPQPQPQPPFPRPQWSQLSPRPRRPHPFPAATNHRTSFITSAAVCCAATTTPALAAKWKRGARLPRRPRWRRRRSCESGRKPGGEEEGGRMYHCTVCNKAFASARAVFGHMRKHPDRGWTGAHPPPVFRAEEEFADLQAVDNAQPPAAAEAEEEEANYRVPDLNNPPPPDSN